MMRAKQALLLAALFAAACGEGPEREGKRADRPEAAEPELGWQQGRMDGARALLFGARGEAPLVAFRCDSSLESLAIDRIAKRSRAGIGWMSLRVDGRTRRLPVITTGTDPAVSTAMLRLEDRLADGLSRLGGKIELRLGREEPLKLPQDRRIGTLIEECRQAQLR